MLNFQCSMLIRRAFSDEHLKLGIEHWSDPKLFLREAKGQRPQEFHL